MGVAAPAGTLSRRACIAFGLSVVAAGAGSFGFHGPAWPGAHWLHDLGTAAPLLFIAASDLARLRGRDPDSAVALFGAAAAGAGALLAALPDAAVPLQAASALLAGAAELAVRRLRPRALGQAAYRWALVGLAVGAAADLLGRTGGPLCDPDSLLQGHALWHVLSAAALTGWALADER